MKSAPPTVAMIPRTFPPEINPDCGGGGVGFIGSDLSTSVKRNQMKSNMLAMFDQKESIILREAVFADRTRHKRPNFRLRQLWLNGLLRTSSNFAYMTE